MTVEKQATRYGHATARHDGPPYRLAITAGTARAHELVGDEPQDDGGQDAGPRPWDLISAGLAACTSTTLWMYAQRKEWPVEDVDVSVDYIIVNRERQLRRVIRLVGDLDAEQRERMLEIAGKTPVTKALLSGLPIDTELA